MSLAVVMITYNEEFHIGDVIDNVKDIADEIYILDSLSTDKTVDIALSKGAVVLQRPFTNFGDQWNFALSHFPVQSEWTMKMDPDERVSEQLKKSIRKALREELADGFSFVRRLWFMGRPLNVKQEILRIWRTGVCHFSNVTVNEHPLVKGKTIYIKGYMEHHDSRDLHHWLEKQNMYTSMEALMRFKHESLSVKPDFFGTALERRMFFKSILNRRFPCKYFLLRIYMLIFNNLLFSGKTAWHWVEMRLFVIRMRDFKVEEMKNTSRLIELPSKRLGSYNEKVLRTTLQQSVLSEK